MRHLTDAEMARVRGLAATRRAVFKLARRTRSHRTRRNLLDLAKRMTREMRQLNPPARQLALPLRGTRRGKR